MSKSEADPTWQWLDSLTTEFLLPNGNTAKVGLDEAAKQAIQARFTEAVEAAVTKKLTEMRNQWAVWLDTDGDPNYEPTSIKAIVNSFDVELKELQTRSNRTAQEGES